MTDAIRLETSGALAKIVLNNPARRNALTLDMWAALPGLIDRVVENADTKVLIVHGGASAAFAAGADISEFGARYGTPADTRQSGQIIAAALNAVEHCVKPTIAAINGACVGGGVSLAMACDLRIASPDSTFGVTPSKLGIVYPAGDTRRLLNAIGPGAAKDILFTGRLFAADEALRMRMIDRLSAPEAALDEALAWGEEIASVSQWSTRAVKKMIAGLQAGWHDEDPRAEALFLEGFANTDFEDGHKAFLDKRKPDFRYK